MSSSFLSLRDVGSWVPEASLSKGGAGFISKLFTTITGAMASLATHHNESERFVLWGQGLSVVDGDLDEVLRYSKELRVQVLSLLLRLGLLVLEGLSGDEVPTSQLLTEQIDDLRTLLDTTESIVNEYEPDDFARPDTPSDSDSSEYDTAAIWEEISIYIDCLLDLSASLDNPALDVTLERADGPSSQAKESFVVSSEEALIYCRKIRDRFEVLPRYLAERLAEANVLRAANLRKMRSRDSRYDVQINDDITESLFSSNDHRITETTKSTANSSSVFSSAIGRSSRWSEASFSRNDDNASEATFASFSTAASAIGMGRPRVPPIPEIQRDGFNCPVCFLHIKNVKKRKEWKKHVFNDLKPYVCTVEDCTDTAVMYSHSGIWAKHETTHESSTLGSFCPFCSATYRKDGPSYYKHLSAHFREVSLSVLPQQISDDAGFDTDDSDSQSSASISPAPSITRSDEPRNESAATHSYIETAGGPFPERYFYPRRRRSPSPRSVNGHSPSPHTRSTVSPGEVEPVLTTEAGTTSDPFEVDLDSVIDRLVAVRGSPGKQVQLLEAEIRYLCSKAMAIFLLQPILLELEAPLTVIGDIHGQYYDLLRIFESCGFPPESNYLFLGNYVDYGTQSLETICLILAYKIKYPENFFPLRGNHECAAINRICGFYDECKKRYNVRLWKCFTDLFNCMPVAAIIDEKIFCMHGGLSPDLNSMEQIRRVMRPTDIPDCGLLCDLLWSNPDDYITGWDENVKDADENIDDYSFRFGPDVVSRFLEKHDMDLIVRGNKVVEEGYEFLSGRQLVTVWNAPNFKGEYSNAGAMMSINESLLCSFKFLKPEEDTE